MGLGVWKFTPADPGAKLSGFAIGGSATGFQGLSGYRMFGMPSDQRLPPLGRGGWEMRALPNQAVVRQDETQPKTSINNMFMPFYDDFKGDEDDEDLLVTIFLSRNASRNWFLNPNS